MKVLYIGVFHDGTGYSYAAINNALALDAVGIDVAVRTVKLNNRQGEVPDRIRELEAKSADRPDVVLQHVLPHQMTYTGHISKNIGVYSTETSNFESSGWAASLNTMDQAWVSCEQSWQASLVSGVNIPIHVVPYPVDTSKFSRSYNPLPLRDKFGDRFIFYTIGETNKRKNFAALLKAFHLEFDPAEPVELVIKTNSDLITKLCEEVKTNLKLYRSEASYKQEIIIGEYWTEELINRLHYTCDCYVSSSFGESWGLPAFDAMGFGKTPIVTEGTGFDEYIDNNTGWPVRAREEPVWGVLDTFKDLYTGRETWQSIDVIDLQHCMRIAYEDKSGRESKSREGRRRAYDFGYGKVGQQMKNILEGGHV